MGKLFMRHFFMILAACFLCMYFAVPALAKLEDRVQLKVIHKKISPNELKKNKSINTARKNTGGAGEMPRPKSDIAKAKPNIGKVKTGAASKKSAAISIEKNEPTRTESKKNERTRTESKRYDPSGKIDPFTPIIKDEPEPPKRLVTYIDRPVKPTTDLEKVDLSQLKLTGVILASSGNRALVQESSGRGHVVKIDTPIGRRGGKVIEISKDKIIVQERMRDYSGKIIVKKRVLLSAAKLDNSM